MFIKHLRKFVLFRGYIYISFEKHVSLSKPGGRCQSICKSDINEDLKSALEFFHYSLLESAVLGVNHLTANNH